MRPSSDHVSGAQLAPVRSEERDLHTIQSRVAAEFREMSGLKLTVSQAARLFDIEIARCERILGALVARDVLLTDGRAFARADARCV